MSKIKSKTVYSCQQCGYQSPKWLGRCMECGAWNSFAEETFTPASKNRENGFFELKSDEALPLSKITSDSKPRWESGVKEFDRVLGGGVVPGSLVLLGGDPGIGKSTLVLQILNRLYQKGVNILYATGEESAEQIKMRSDRLGIQSDVLVLSENSLERVIAQVQKLKPNVLVIDSIQTVYLPELDSAPGSLSQVRECAGKLLYLSKSTGMATILIGHVTKEGSLAGPRVLEHMVDTVLYFEGEARQNYRLLRSIKNRYGSTHELGVFDMGQDGLTEVANPSFLFLPDKESLGVGSAVTASLEGARPFLVEIQALVSSSVLANPRRTTLGVDPGRVALLVAVLEKMAGLNLYFQDIYVNAAGGFKVVEPAADLSIIAALISSFKNKPLPDKTLFLGEVSLSGALRGVSNLEVRLKEASKLGFTQCVLATSSGKKINTPSEIKIVPLRNVGELIEFLF